MKHTETSHLERELRLVLWGSARAERRRPARQQCGPVDFVHLRRQGKQCTRLLPAAGQAFRSSRGSGVCSRVRFKDGLQCGGRHRRRSLGDQRAAIPATWKARTSSSRSESLISSVRRAIRHPRLRILRGLAASPALHPRRSHPRSSLPMSLLWRMVFHRACSWGWATSSSTRG